MEIAYGFFRFGRYSYDIVEVLESMGSVADCDKSAVLEMAMITREDDTFKRKIIAVQEIKTLQDNSIKWMIS